MDIQVRAETPADISLIEAVNVAAFASPLHDICAEAVIVRKLREAGTLFISLVATIDDAIVGHVAISPVAIADGTALWFGLGPVSVRPEFQRRGVGSKLIILALNTLRTLGAHGCVVLGDPNFYGRFGFQACEQLTFPGFEPRYFQALKFAPSMAAGVVTYDKAFG
jgi:putative acetyltransferase